MPKRSPRYSSRPPLVRMKNLHDRLVSDSYPNCNKLAEEWGVSPRTVQRDIDFMRDAMGLPIAYHPTCYGFYYTKPVSNFPSVQVSEGELVTLLIAQKALQQYQGTSFEEPLRRAFEKITSGMTDEIKFQWHDLDTSFSIRSVGVPLSDMETFAKLGEAVNLRHQVEFEYRKLECKHFENRKVQPYHLTCVEHQWYLFGWDVKRKAIRTFALPRMRNLVVTNISFQRDARFSVARLLKNSFGIFAGSSNYQVKIKFDRFASQLIREKVWHNSQVIQEHKDGSLTLSMVLGSLREVERWVLSWKAHAKVLTPSVLKKRIKNTLDEMRLLYEGFY